MSMAERIEGKLREGLSPARLRVVDESGRHVGHAGWRPEGETHFRVEIVSDGFAGLSRVDRQRLVYDLLSEELAGGLHALALRTLTVEEAAPPDR